MENLLGLFGDYNEHRIKIDELRHRIHQLVYECPEYENSSIGWGLIHAFELLGEGLVTESFVDGYVDGVLSAFAPCPIRQGIEMGSNTLTVIMSNLKEAELPKIEEIRGG